MNPAMFWIGVLFWSSEAVNGTGLCVRVVADDSPAQIAGLRAGSCFVAANGRPIAGLESLVEAVNTAGRAGSSFTLELRETSGRVVQTRVRPVPRPATADETLCRTAAERAPTVKVSVSGGALREYALPVDDRTLRSLLKRFNVLPDAWIVLSVRAHSCVSGKGDDNIVVGRERDLGETRLLDDTAIRIDDPDLRPPAPPLVTEDPREAEARQLFLSAYVQHGLDPDTARTKLERVLEIAPPESALRRRAADLLARLPAAR